jgi:hypothetical protein
MQILTRLQAHMAVSSCVIAILLLRTVRMAISVFCDVTRLTVIAIYCLHLHSKYVRHAQ